MYYGGYYGMYWDPTYILVIIGMVICLLASARVKSTYAKFNRVRSHSGITAAEAAEKILHGAGIYDVEIRHISGDLTDNYDPSNRVLNLSDATFRSRLLRGEFKSCPLLLRTDQQLSGCFHHSTIPLHRIYSI